MKSKYEIERVPFYAVLLDCFAAPCFVVEDKHELHQEMGSNTSYLLDGISSVKPRDEA